MSTFDPNDNGPRVSSGNAGGGWIIGIIVVVLVGLSVWWWAGPGGAGPRTANIGSSTPATTDGSALSSSPATPPAAQSDTTK